MFTSFLTITQTVAIRYGWNKLLFTTETHRFSFSMFVLANQQMSDMVS